jgi:hypothetical protein
MLPVCKERVLEYSDGSQPVKGTFRGNAAPDSGERPAAD